MYYLSMYYRTFSNLHLGVTTAYSSTNNDGDNRVAMHSIKVEPSGSSKSSLACNSVSKSNDVSKSKEVETIGRSKTQGF